jgi:hypothetical protein
MPPSGFLGLRRLRMTFDEHIKSILEATRAQVAAPFQERLQSLAADLGKWAAAEHSRALEAALSSVLERINAEHEAAMAALRTEAAEQRDLAISMARTEAAEEREVVLAAARAESARQHEEALANLRAEAAAQQEAALGALRSEITGQQDASLAALRAEMAAEHDATLAILRNQLAEHHASAIAAIHTEASQERENLAASIRSEYADAHQAELAAVRAEADERVARAKAEAEELLAHVRADADQRLAGAQAEAEANVARAGSAQADAEAATERAVVEARASERQAEIAFAERLADAVRRLDSARSLTDVIDVLVDASTREVPRVAVFMIRGNTFAGWRAAGFSRDEDPRDLEVPFDHAGLLSKAIGSTEAIVKSDAMSAEADGAPFGSLPAACAAVAVPLRVGGETVGVLYADDVSPREHPTPSPWPESIEVLARHACRCLEAITVARVTQPVSIPAPSKPTPLGRRYTPQSRALAAGHDDDDDAARRYARLLVSEIKLYHESVVTAGRRDRNLLERLRTEIDRARRLYDERVPPEVLARTDYFNQELVRTLANGDASLLGPA